MIDCVIVPGACVLVTGVHTYCVSCDRDWCLCLLVCSCLVLAPTVTVIVPGAHSCCVIVTGVHARCVVAPGVRACCVLLPGACACF